MAAASVSRRPPSSIGAASATSADGPDPFEYLNAEENRLALPDSVRRAIVSGNLVNATSPHREHYKRTLLHLAVWADNRPAAFYLIDQGADINQLDELHDSPFLLAGAEGRVEIMEYILTNAARVRKYGSSTSRRQQTAVPNMEVVNRYGGSALIPACERGHAAMVTLLLEKSDVDVNHYNNYRLTGLLETVLLGGDDADHVAVTKALIQHGVNVNQRDGAGSTPLRIAREKNYTRIAAMLEAAGGTE